MITIFHRYCFIIAIVLFSSFAAGESSAAISSSLLSALQSNDNWIRSFAVEELGNIRDEEAITNLMKVVAHKEEDWRIRIKAIRLLGEIGNPHAVDLLLKVYSDPFLNEECPAIKWTIILALGNFKNHPDVVETLIGALSYDNLIIREAGIQSLGNIGDPQAVPFLIPALNDKSFAIRHSAIKALGKIGASEAVPILKKIAETTDDALIRSEALSALASLK